MPLLPLIAVALVQTQAPSSFADTWGTIRQGIEARYYGRSTKKAEMDRLLTKYEPQAKAAKNREEFSRTVNAMIDEFGDSHFDYFTPADQGYYVMDALANSVRNGTGAAMPHIGIWFKDTPQGPSAQMVMHGQAREADIRKNDVFLLIDGKPFSPVESLKGKAGQKAKFTIMRAGQRIEKELEIEETSALDMFLNATRNSIRVIEHKGKKIGYIHVWTHASDGFRNVLRGAVNGSLRNTDALIFDNRDGFGGRPEGFLDQFFLPEVSLEWKSPAGSMTQMTGYGKPMAMLINEGSRSAKEVVAFMFKKGKRGQLIGAQTGGNVLGTSPWKVNDWSYLEIPMVEVVADGQRLEKNGVMPDIKVEPQYGPAGEDLILRRALEQLTGG